MTALDAAARLYARRRHALNEARDILRTQVLAALADGTTEVEVARRAGVTRMTIRAWRRDGT